MRVVDGEKWYLRGIEENGERIEYRRKNWRKDVSGGKDEKETEREMTRNRRRPERIKDGNGGNMRKRLRLKDEREEGKRQQ